MKKSLVILLLLFLNNAYAQVTLNLHPNATNGIDALIDNSSASTNYGTTQDFAAWAWTSGGATTARSLLKFDLSSIPSNATITSATLSLYCNTTSSVTQLNSGANACLLQRITSAWTETGVTWNNQPTTTAVNQDTLAQSTSTTQNYPSIDVKNLVIDMVNNPSTSYGFMLKLMTEATYRCMVMSSSDNSDSTKWPRLVIMYSIANNYYSKATGSLDSLSTWGTNSNGTGTSPTSFGANNTIYNIVNNSSPVMSNSWYITGTNTAVVLGDGTNTLNTSIPSGLSFGADSIYVRNNVTFTILGTLITNKPGFENGSTVQYTNTGAQNLQTASFYNLVVSGGTKSLISNITVRGTLAMLANINCGINTLTVGSSATQTGSITYGSGIITGNISRWFAASTNAGSSSGLFPIGTVTLYRPIQIEFTSAPSSGGILTALFTASNPGSSGLSPALTDFSISPIVSVNKAAPNGYWTITSSSGIAGGTYTTTATATGFYGVSSLAGLRLLKRSNSSSAWSLTGSAVTPTGTTSIPVVSRTSITSIGGDFGIGADSSVNSLPIKLISFDAKLLAENKVQLNWNTASEIKNNYFDVERSENNIEWQSIGKVDGNGTTNIVSNYQFSDQMLKQIQHDETIYYRLKQVDFDGIGAYSKIVSVKFNSVQEQISIYPNPSDGNFVIENDVTQNSNINVTIINLIGEKLWSNSYDLQSGKNTTNINVKALSPGIYFLQIEDNKKQIIEVRKVLVN